RFQANGAVFCFRQSTPCMERKRTSPVPPNMAWIRAKHAGPICSIYARYHCVSCICQACTAGGKWSVTVLRFRRPMARTCVAPTLCSRYKVTMLSVALSHNSLPYVHVVIMREKRVQKRGTYEHVLGIYT